MAGAALGIPASEPLAIGTPMYRRETVGQVGFLRNPDFVFPAQSDQSTRAAPSWPSAQRPRSTQDLVKPAAGGVVSRSRASVSALPSFSFNPAATSQSHSVITPPLSPTQVDGPSTPSRSTRHRRRGSELIGGDRNGSISTTATSPTKPEDVLSRNSLHLGPPAGRRHAHRRSGAISCHDLTSILQPKDGNAQVRAGSAPTSPMDLDNAKSFFSPGEHVIEAHVAPDFSIDQITDLASPHRRPLSRARVGFADRVEYIRPLSTISSETEGSMSTIRGHSVTESLSSIQSAGATSSSPARMARPSLNTTFEDDGQRPQTSQAILGSPVVHQSAFGPPQRIQERPRSEAGLSSVDDISDSQLKRKSFGWWDAKARRPSPSESLLKESPNSSEQSLTSESISPKKPRRSLESDQETVRAKAVSKKPRKVRSWAHSLISRKPKEKKSLVRPASPYNHPLSLEDSADESDSSVSQLEEIEPAFEINFDDDNTVTIVNEAARPSTANNVDGHLNSLTALSDSDVLCPVIDLDAALGPFSTRLSPNALAGYRQIRPRRSMHSASLASGSFASGPQHRRTESAPELLPFDGRGAKILQPSVMPDVFEEEDEDLAAQEYEKEDAAVSDKLSTCSSNSEADAMQAEPTTRDHAITGAGPWLAVSGFGLARRKKSEGLSIDTGSRPSSMVLDSPGNSHTKPSTDHLIRSAAVEVVEDHEEVRHSKSSDETVTPPLSGGKAVSAQPALRFPVPLPSQQVMTPDTISDVSLYSPFFSPSQGSFDTTRLDTASSSVTDGPAFSFGEPGPELRSSCDDVPSLTSSRSTMTYANQIMLPPPLPNSLGERAPSVHSMRGNEIGDDSRAKRASIASLSRLIPSGLGERSKLSIESRPASQHVVTGSPGMTKSRHRLSKLVRFWKGKEQRISKT